MTDEDGELELKRQIEQARRLAAAAGPNLNFQLVKHVAVLERQLADFKRKKPGG